MTDKEKAALMDWCCENITSAELGLASKNARVLFETKKGRTFADCIIMLRYEVDAINEPIYG